MPEARLRRQFICRQQYGGKTEPADSWATNAYTDGKLDELNALLPDGVTLARPVIPDT